MFIFFQDMICDPIIESKVVVNDISGDNYMKGDGSRRYALPTMTGTNPDLKTISHDTVSLRKFNPAKTSYCDKEFQ